MTFESGEEETCRKYMETRGIYLYKQVYDALSESYSRKKTLTRYKSGASSFLR